MFKKFLISAFALSTIITGSVKNIAVNTEHYLSNLFSKANEQIGYSVVSRYRTTLQSSMTSSQTTVPVSSITTFDGHVLTMSDLGGKVYLSIEPGTSREEIVACTLISSSQWASCTRGLAFYGSSEASVSANQKAHNAGSIVIMSDVHFVFENFVDVNNKIQTIQGDRTATGTWTFNQIPTIPSTTPSAVNQAASVNYVNTIAIQGSPTATESIPGIARLGTRQQMASSSYNAANPTVLYTRYSTSSPQSPGVYAVISGDNGKINTNFIDVSSSYSWAGTQTFNATTTFASTTNFTTSSNFQINSTSFTGTMTDLNRLSSGPKWGGTGTDGALTITSGTTILDALNQNILIKNYTSFTMATGTVLTITNASSTGTILWIKVSGDCTVSGTILLDGFGGVGGATTTAGAGAAQAGVAGTGGFSTNYLESSVLHGGGAGQSATVDKGSGGGGGGGALNPGSASAAASNAAGASGGTSIMFRQSTSTIALNRALYLMVGSGGGSGGGDENDAGSRSTGKGGNGGGSLMLECAGTLNFFGTISLKGQNGNDAETPTASSDSGLGGGGGGGGGLGLLMANTMGTLTGTVTSTAGAGGLGKVGIPGSGGGGTASDGARGGDGYGLFAQNLAFF